MTTSRKPWVEVVVVGVALTAALLLVVSLAGNALPSVFDGSPGVIGYWFLYLPLVGASLAVALAAGVLIGQAAARPRAVLTAAVLWWLSAVSILGAAVGSVTGGPIYTLALVLLLASATSAISVSAWAGRTSALEQPDNR